MRVQNVVIPAQHFQQTVSFYRNTLGFPALSEGPEFCLLKAGAINIAIHRVEPDSDFAPTGRGMYLDVIVSDIHQVHRRLQAANVAIARAWADQGRQFLVVADPEGNLVEFIPSKQSR